MSDFYGGMPGKSFIIKARFGSLEEMWDAFKKGPDYTDVWYGEYVLIDTENKNNPHNGEIYRRGIDYNHKGIDPDDPYGNTKVDDGNAEYIGQIVGPASGTPWFSMGPLSHTEAMSTKDLNLDIHEERRYPIEYDEEKGEFVTYYDDENNNEDFPIGTFSFNTDEGSLVPGKVDGKEEYHDEIRFNWVNIRTADKNNDSWFYVGMEIPYPVVEFNTEAKYPYDEDGVYDGSAPIERDDDKKHNFYRHYTFQVPQGIKGDSLSNLRRVVVEEGDVFYNISDITYESKDGKTGVLTVRPSTYSTVPGSKNIGKTVIVYDISVYDHTNSPTKTSNVSGDTATPDVISVYLANYDQIERAEITHTGVITFIENNGDRITVKNLDGTDFQIRYIDDIKLSPDANLNEDKRIQVLYNVNNPDNDKTSATAKYVPIGDPINYVQEIVIDKQNYHLYVLYNDPTHRLHQSDIDDSNTGVTCLDSDDKDTGNRFQTKDGVIWERRINLNVASDETKKLLGWIQDGTEPNGTYGNPNSAIVLDTFWRDYCAVKDQSGVLIGLNFTYDEIFEDIADNYPDDIPVDDDDKKWHNVTNGLVIKYLNEKYDGGLTGENTGDGSLTGKIVCIGDDPFDKRMFAYDYNTNTWFYLGKTNENDMYDAKLLDRDYDDGQNPIPLSDYNNTTIGGLIFLERSDVVNPDPIPKFWKNSYWWADDSPWYWRNIYEL